MTSTLKAAVFTVFRILTFPVVILYILLRPIRGADSAFMAVSQFLSLFPGKTGIYLRSATYSQICNSVSPDASIGFLTIFSHVDTDIAESVYIGAQSNIGMCSIGRKCLLGSGVHVLSGKNQHGFSDPGKAMKDQPGEYRKITIGENCWIGNNATVMADIGIRCIVAAGAVVTHSVPNDSVVAGNPARVVKRLG